MSLEPEYVDVDDEGRSTAPKQYPKWMTPKKDSIQSKLLDAVDRKRYHTRDEQSTCNEIARKALSLANGVESPYPIEWVEFCCQWARDKRAKREWVQLLGLLNFIRDADKKVRWLDQHRGEYERDDTWEDYAN